MRAAKRLARSGCLLVFTGMLFLGAGPRELSRENAGSSENGGVSGDVCVLRMTYPVDDTMSVTDDLGEIEDAVNAVAAEKIGAVVELLPVDTVEAWDDYMLMLARGDTLDLMLVRDQDISAYIDNGFLEPLNSYLTWNAEYLLSVEEETEGMLTKGAQQQGRTYGIANLTGEEAEGYGLWISKAVLDTAGIVWEDGKIWSLEEIDRLLGRLKSLYPESYPLGQITARNNTSVAEYYISVGNTQGAALAAGTVRGVSDTVVNLFESEEYRELLYYMERWYDAEYILPESVTYDGMVIPLLEEGRILLYPASSRPGTMDRILGHETDWVCLRTAEPAVRETYVRDGYWTVPLTSNYPEEAVRFLNLMYEDPHITELLNYGLEGKHYSMSESGERLWITDENGDFADTGFYNPAAKIGDLRSLNPFGTAEVLAAADEYDAEALGKNDRYDGFIFTTSEYTGKLETVREVVRRYAPLLESGSVETASVYPEFIRALREAGIDDIISGRQSQLNGWLEANR